MTVFDVYVNERKCCRAGVGPDGVLTALVNWVKLSGDAARTARRLRHPIETSRLEVAGLRRGTHRSWLDRDLKVGDRVAIAVSAAGRADRPARQYRTQSREREKTAFLNVDLDLRSRAPVESLVKRLGPGVFALHVGREGRGHAARLEAAAQSSSPGRLIRRFVALVERLPARERRLWDRADVREFNIGIQAPTTAAGYELHLDPVTIRAAARVNATIGVTVYSPR
jgi:hypothetical protein